MPQPVATCRDLNTDGRQRRTKTVDFKNGKIDIIDYLKLGFDPADMLSANRLSATTPVTAVSPGQTAALQAYTYRATIHWKQEIYAIRAGC